MKTMTQWTRLLCATLTLLLAAANAAAGDGKIRRVPHPIKDEYIVVLESRTLPDEVPAIAQRLARQHGAKVNRVWGYALKGFFATMTEARAEAMSRHPEVAYVEENAQMFLSATVPTNVEPGCVTNCQPTTDNRLWHLDSMDQNAAVGTKDFSWCTDGTGVHVYVVDTGVMRAHQEFDNDATRVVNGYDSTGDPSWFPAWDPCHGAADNLMHQDGYVRGNAGHGTGVASLVAGKTLGVARNAKIVPVKTWPCGYAGARELRANTSYALNEIAMRDSTTDIYYRVVTAGTTSSTQPASSAWCTTAGCRLTWGGVELEYYALSTAMPKEPTAQMLIEGLDWILRPGQLDANGNPPPGGLGSPYPKSPAVVTLSTYRLAHEDGSASWANGSSALTVEDAIRNLLAYNNGQGITVTASANNQGGNACDTTPARMSVGAANTNRVITVGGTMLRNNPDANPADGGPQVALPEPAHDPSKPTLFARWRCHAGDSDNCTGNVDGDPPALPPAPTAASYIGTLLGSNGGQCVTLFAPAKNIPVADMTATNGYRNSRIRGGAASGTSWATPIAAGMAARILQSNPSYTANQVRTALLGHTRADLDPLHLDPPNVTGTPNAVLQLTDVTVNDLPATIAAATSGPTTITATASGVSSLTYELFQVSSSFNVALSRRNAAASTRIAGPQPGNTFSVSPTTDTSYFVRVRSSCASADSSIATVVVTTPPAAPANFTATGSAGQVNFSWSTVSNADGYRIEHKLPGVAWTTTTTVTGGSTATASAAAPSAPEGVVLYRVLATRSSVASAPSVPDVAWVGAFTGDPVIAASTVVHAIHIIELRRAVNALCNVAGIPLQFTAAETANNALAGLDVDDVHFGDLMTRLNAARTNAAVGMAPWAYSTSLSGKIVSGIDINDVRNGIK